MDLELLTEQDHVDCWRELELLRAGYPHHVAAELSQLAHVDLHVAVDLLKHGCPLDLALNILR